jgi:hypothetical protein
VVKTYFHETWRGDIINYGTFDSVRTKPSKMETRNAPPVGEHGVMYSPMSSIQSTSSEQQTNWGWNHWNRWNTWNLMAILDISNRHISKERVCSDHRGGGVAGGVDSWIFGDVFRVN